MDANTGRRLSPAPAATRLPAISTATGHGHSRQPGKRFSQSSSAVVPSGEGVSNHRQSPYGLSYSTDPAQQTAGEVVSLSSRRAHDARTAAGQSSMPISGASGSGKADIQIQLVSGSGGGEGGHVVVMADDSGKAAATRMQARLMADRMAHQESMLKRLLERGYRIQQDLEKSHEEMKDGFRFGKKQRDSLYEHVRTTSELLTYMVQQSDDFRKHLKSLEERMCDHGDSIRQLDKNVHILALETRRRAELIEMDVERLIKDQAAAGEAVFNNRENAKKDKQIVETALSFLQERLKAVDKGLQSAEEQLEEGLRRQQTCVERVLTTTDEKCRSLSADMQSALMETQNFNIVERDRLREKVIAQLEDHEAKLQQRMKTMETTVHDVFERFQSQMHAEFAATRDFRDTLQHQLDGHKHWQETTLKEYEKNCASTLEQAQRSLESMRGMLNAREAVLREELRREWDAIAKSLMVV